MNLISTLALLILCLSFGNSHADDIREATPLDGVAPITGENFERLLSAQHVDLQEKLTSLFPESEGFMVNGPLDPLQSGESCLYRLMNSLQVVCLDNEAQNEAEALFQISPLFDPAESFSITDSSCLLPLGADLFLGSIKEADSAADVLICTINRVRWLIWVKRIMADPSFSIEDEILIKYIMLIGRYLDGNTPNADPPLARSFGVLPRLDFLAPQPDYVIQGYQNYKDFLFSHAEIKTDFTSGILAFVPTAATLAMFEDEVPRAAFRNKEAAALQHEYRKFFRRGGNLRIIQTLTRTGFDTLTTGEYFFAVSPGGTIRFGRELLREEVTRLEKETGQKVPRANHAFLFPGQPILTAGAFFIDERAEQKLVKVNAQSGHYFYSNLTSSVKEDISLRSDGYLLSLGHFFRALKRLEIKYDQILIRKL